MMDEQVCIFSYNSRGFNDCKKDFVKSLINIAGCQAIICNQENFILKKNAYVIEQTLPDHTIFFKDAIKNGLEGRPKNGMFIAFPKCLKTDKIKDVSPESFRIQSIVVTIGAYRLLVVNTYFPTDPGSDFDENELLTIFSDVESVLANNEFDNIILAGDLNTDFRRNTKFVKLVDEFVSNVDGSKSWDHFQVDFTHVTEREGSTYTSVIDHFLWDKGLCQHVEEAGVLHVPENMSDHSPIYCKLHLPKSEQRDNASAPTKRKLPSWRKAGEIERANFASELNTRLKEIEYPVHSMECDNVNCMDEAHKFSVDHIMAQALDALEQTASKLIPETREQPGKRRIPDWKEDVAPVKDNAYFWHSVWVSAGKPMNCSLHSIMKMTRNRYHFVLRKKKRLIERLRRNNMLQSCLDNDSNIFEEIKRIRRCHQNPPSTIDGISEDIPGYLANKYEKLYNGVEDKNNLNELEHDLRKTIDDKSMVHVNKITPDIIKRAALKLKPIKTDPVVDIRSDFLINAPDTLYWILAKCLKSYITHAHVSEFLLISMMIPIIKDKLGDHTSSDNYRSIAISSLIMKIFDQVIILVFGEHLQLDELQFGYQAEVSTTMCTWLAVESISHFLRNGSEVYTCLMDMSKAFDMVQHSHLFRKLLDQGMPPVIVRFILASYKEQKANVNWNGVNSRYFGIGNGVKQGAILSAVLYCVYTNELYKELRRSNIGCRLGKDYVGVLGYADDLFLISPTIDGLQDMLKICERYAKNHNLKFSTNQNPAKSKTKCMAFLHKDRQLRKLRLCGNELPWVEKGKHLGIKIANNPSKILNDDVMEKRARYIQSNNELMQEFSFVFSCTKAFINRVFNSHFYGSVLWNLYSRETIMLYNTWSVSIRKMFRLDRKSHRYLIEPISGMPHIRQALMKRFLGFTEKLATSRKSVLKRAYNIFKADCRSTTGSNIRNIMLECNAIPSTPLCTEVEKLQFKPVPPDDKWRIGFISDLIGIRDGGDTDVGINRDELNIMLEHLCTT